MSFSLSYLVMPFMGTDLGKLMKMERLSEDRVQFLVYQILRGLKVRRRYTHTIIFGKHSILLYSFVVSINLSVLLFYHSTFIQPGSFTGYVTSEFNKMHRGVTTSFNPDFHSSSSLFSSLRKFIEAYIDFSFKTEYIYNNKYELLLRCIISLVFC